LIAQPEYASGIQEDAMRFTDDSASWVFLIEACLRGDRDAWIDLDRQVRPKLAKAFRKRLGPAVDEDQLVSDVLHVLVLKDMKTLREFHRRGGCLMALLTTIGRRLHLQTLRTSKRRLKNRGPSGDPRRAIDSSVDPLDLTIEVEAFLPTLGDKSKAALLDLIGEHHDSELENLDRNDDPTTRITGATLEEEKRSVKTHQRLIQRMVVGFAEQLRRPSLFV
jgi:DNA-directed RNA polymerase specialized sigma24 family protein